jgi:hypothetical protein
MSNPKFLGDNMLQQRAPMIAVGQIYLHDDENLNQYIIVKKNAKGQITWGRPGLVGHTEDQAFIERFKPVDVADVDQDDLEAMLSVCPPNTKASTGFILED